MKLTLLFFLGFLSFYKGGDEKVTYFPTGEKKSESKYYAQCDCDSIREYYQTGENLINKDLYNKYLTTVQSGETLFESYCTSCHQMNKTLIGPALNGIGNRRSDDWIFKMIRNESLLLKAGDKEAIALHGKYWIVHPTYLELDDYQINNIIAYLKGKK